MAHTSAETSVQARMQRLDTLIQEADQFADPAAQSHLRDIVRTLLDLHGAGLERILDRVAAIGEQGQTIIDDLGRDDLVASLLLLYGLHPLDVTARVRQALEEVRPYLRSHGGNVMLLGIADGVVRLRLEGSCHSCPSSSITMRQTIETAIVGKAPDVTAVEVEELSDGVPVPADPPARFALPLL